MTSSVLDVRAVSKNYGGKQVLSDVTFSVTAGEVVGIIGRNGAGKSTLLDVLSGVAQPAQGSVWFLGASLAGKRPHQISRLGAVRTFQALRLYGDMTALDTVLVSAFTRRWSREDSLARSWEALAEVGLAERAHQLTREFSTGQSKRLELAAARVTQARLYMLDEITGGVDMAHIDEISDSVRRIAATGATVMMVEHNIPLVRRMCTRLVCLHLGRVIADGGPEEVLASAAVREAYLS